MTRASRSPLLVLLLTLLLVVLIRTAWVSDDAFITFRTIDNFNHGFGLRWNIDERVQTYTHPLWMMLLAAFSQVTPHLYLASIALSLGLTMTTVWILATRVAVSQASALVAVTALVFSRAFTDYSSSGLENPLTHLLLVAFFWLYFTDTPGRRRLVLMGLVAGLAVLNRFDTALLIGPALVATWARERRHVIVSALVSAVPVAAWELFSIVYYGLPLPNTVYAKLQTGIPALELVSHGLIYLADSVATDPITLAIVTAVTAVGVATGRSRDWPVMFGVVLFLGVLVRAGGDFMSGRMISAPFVCAVVLLSRFEWIEGDRLALTACAVAAALGLAAPRPTVWSNSADADTKIGSSGIADERRFYYQATGLLMMPWQGEHPASFEAEPIAQARLAGKRSVQMTQIGLAGFFAGPGVHIIDPLGLGDPLLARLPAAPGWRVGHYRRDLPAGYADSVENDANLIQDPALAAYYERLRTITRDPIWSLRRARVIVRANLGAYGYLIPPREQ